MTPANHCPTCGLSEAYRHAPAYGCPDSWHGTGIAPEQTRHRNDIEAGEATEAEPQLEGAPTSEWLARMEDPLIRGSESFRLTKTEITQILAAAKQRGAIEELEKFSMEAGLYKAVLYVEARLKALRGEASEHGTN